MGEQEPKSLSLTPPPRACVSRRLEAKAELGIEPSCSDEGQRLPNGHLNCQTKCSPSYHLTNASLGVDAVGLLQPGTATFHIGVPALFVIQLPSSSPGKQPIVAPVLGPLLPT